MRWSIAALMIGLGMIGAAGFAACGGDGGGGTGGTGGSGGTGGNGVGGDGAGPQTGGAGGTGGSSSSSSSSSGGYTTCGDCTDGTSGLPTHECAAQWTACHADTGCENIYQCSYVSPGCESSTKAGACCTVDCYGAESQASIDLFKAADGCVYCTTCKTLCDTAAYCAIFAGTDTCP